MSGLTGAQARLVDEAAATAAGVNVSASLSDIEHVVTTRTGRRADRWSRRSATGSPSTAS
ncbi:MAG: hypothetical protein ACRDPY_20435 [Streptosporangiaceae bacterium]